MKKLQKSMVHLCTLLLLVGTLTLGGCFTHEHIVGDGAQQGLSESKRVWYVAYGLAAISEVDTQEMAQGATNYTIKTEQSFIDGLIYSILFGLVGPRTVTVTR